MVQQTQLHTSDPFASRIPAVNYLGYNTMYQGVASLGGRFASQGNQVVSTGVFYANGVSQVQRMFEQSRQFQGLMFAAPP